MIPGADFAPLLRRFRRRAAFRSAARGLAWGLLAAGVASLFLDRSLAIVVGLLTGFAAGGACYRALGAWRLNAPLLARHLDRRFPELEESTGLLLSEPATLDTVRRLQRARVAPYWHRVHESPGRWLPAPPPLREALPAALGVLLLLGGPGLLSRMEGRGAPEGSAATASDPAGVAAAPRPELLELRVTPPAYTAQPAFIVTGFDAEFPEGSRLAWTLAWEPETPLQLVLTDGTGTPRRIALAPDGEGRVHGAATVDTTSLYRLERGVDGAFFALPGVYTLSAVLDRKPTLRIEAPRETAVERPPEGPLDLDYTVRVEDDHGVQHVEIRASVAKGSGEGVKFRDEVFAFDASEALEDGARHERRWNLARLGMEPGDEVYFFTIARDNRQPEANEARSDTVVVRWLDEAPPEPGLEGLAIDVMPEYFKSQRQIIIETEQLIADRDRLATEDFESSSRALGQDQAALKDRYGQYLGDEAGEGGSPFAVPTASDDGAAAPADDHAGHDHDDEVSPDPAGAQLPDTSGSAEALIERFAHDHGTADIGPITRRNPVGLMKRSIANMWQAELHLRLGKPEQALPYEQEALEYLNLARQADRIYTRRLGFEPPPVSEERRLSGDLDDVESRTWRRDALPDPDPARIVGDLHQLLATTLPGAALDRRDRERLERAAALFLSRARERPALVQHAATLERILQGGRLDTPDCEDCLPALRGAAWSLLPEAEPGPDAGARPALDPLADEWRQVLDRVSPAGEASP